MKKTMNQKALGWMLSIVLAAASVLPGIPPAHAYAQQSGQAAVTADAPVAPGDGAEPETVTEAVYDKNGSAFSTVPSPDEGADRLLPAAFGGTNLALNKPAYSSGNEVDYLTPDLAVDGKANTRWSSAKQDDQWFYVNLGERTAIDRVVIRWQTPADTYKILVSDDGEQWTNVREGDGVIACKGGTEVIDFAPLQARYVKFQGVKRAPVEGVLYGYSFYEFEVYQLNDLQSIADRIEATLTVQAGQTELDWSAAEVPDGYRASVYGSDRLPVIDREGHIRTPLVDAKVNLIVQVEDLNDPNRKVLSDNIAVTVPGQYKQTRDRNAEPDVHPVLTGMVWRIGELYVDGVVAHCRPPGGRSGAAQGGGADARGCGGSDGI